MAVASTDGSSASIRESSGSISSSKSCLAVQRQQEQLQEDDAMPIAQEQQCECDAH
jgi:hypothetical protein